MAERRKRKQTDSSSSPSSSSRDQTSELPGSSQKSGSESESPRCESLKSDDSMFHPLNFKRSQSSQKRGSESESPRCESLKSDDSMFHPLNFEKSQRLQLRGSEDGASTTESVTSDSTQSVNLDIEKTQSQSESCSACTEVSRDTIKLTCGHRICQQCARSDWYQSASPPGYSCPKCGKKPKMKSGDDHLSKTKKSHKEAMQKKFTLTSEGNGDKPGSLRSIYTTLYTITGESEELSGEHEFRHLKRLETQSSIDSPVSLSDIFKPSPNQEKPPRMVLTKGVAGIGKSFSVQKFILDWAEDEANQDVDFVFCFALRELNLISDEKNLHELLTEFHSAVRHVKNSEDYVQTKIIVILDGLDESRLQLDFENFKTVTSLREATSVDNLLVNLIRGNLLPDASLWITSRPAAANQIPAQFVHMVTEIRGFTDQQKVEYFDKRFSHDSNLSKRITSHIQASQSLDIMCQIPIFCWISAVLFQEVFGGEEETEIPQTLTEMMAHFLFAQTKRRSRKYDKKIEKNRQKLLKTHKEFLLKLGKLAFVQLQENNLIFYEEDLEGCGINTEEASVHSGFFNTVLREEDIFSKRRVFFFVHLTVQEFFAALYVYECLTTKNNKELCSFLNLKDEEHTLLDLLKMTVDKMLEEKNGHLDFFLRFLLGLMVEPNQRVLKGLLTPLDPNQDVDKKILTYLRSIRRKTVSPDSCVNLFQTMVEMRDHKVKDEIQEYLKLPDHSKTELTPLHCSALAYMLQISKDELDELDLKSYNTSEEGRRRLIPAVRCSRKAVLKDCKVTEEWVKHLAFGLKFPFSRLRDLDLSNNDLRDSGVKQLCDGLSNQCCRLQILRLSGCMVSEEGCAHLVAALQSNPSHLTKLDLSYNNPMESGVKMLSELKAKPQYKLDILNFDHGGSNRLKPGLKKYACELTLDPNTAHKNLLLSDGNRKATWVEDEQPYPRHMERFDHCLQVLCKQGLKERCYFEVEKEEPFSIGLTYKSIVRKGETNYCKLGRNDKSWCLSCSDDGCYVWRGDREICTKSLCLRSSRVGVYLDWKAGVLSFYKVSSDSLTRLHTINTNFTEALYPAVELHPHTSAVFCQLT